MQLPNDPPLVTVLVPTYARAEYLLGAVRSALAQNYGNLEIIVLDDASPDGTTEAMAVFENETRVRYVRHEQNLGIAGNWRHGIRLARGEFFCLLHDDDTLEPDFVSVLLAPLLADEVLALAFCDHSLMDANGHPLPSGPTEHCFGRHLLPHGVLGAAFAPAVLINNSIPVGASLFRRAVVGPDFIADEAKGAIDYWLLYRVLETGHGACYINRKLMNYRSHQGGMSAKSALSMAEGHLYRHAAVLNNPQFAAWKSQVAAERRHILTCYGIDLAQAGRPAEARLALGEVLREQPSVRATLGLLLASAGPLGRWMISRLRTAA